MMAPEHAARAEAEAERDRPIREKAARERAERLASVKVEVKDGALRVVFPRPPPIEASEKLKKLGFSYRGASGWVAKDSHYVREIAEQARAMFADAKRRR